MDGEEKYRVSCITVYENWKDAFGRVHHFSNYYFVQEKAVVSEKNIVTGDGTLATKGTNWNLYMSDKEGSSLQFQNSMEGVNTLGKGLFGSALGIAALPAVAAYLPGFATASLSSRAASVIGDYGSQVAGNYIAGRRGPDAWLGNINLTSLSISAVNPVSGWKSLAFNSVAGSGLSVTAGEGYNGLGGGKSIGTFAKESVVSFIAGTLTLGSIKRSNRLTMRQIRVDNLTGVVPSSSISLSLGREISKTQNTGFVIGGVSGSLSNASSSSKKE